jgi:hypothetical protein
VSSCTENDLDESEADVVLEILGITNPAVTGNVGTSTCSISGADCVVDADCQVGQNGGVCLPPPTGTCLVSDWTVNFVNKPLSAGGVETPFNDIVVSSVTIAYVNLDGTPYGPPPRTFAVGSTIEADSQGTGQFQPIAFQDIGVDNTTIALVLSFNAQSVAGHKVDVVGLGTAGVQLSIEDCAP